MLLYDNPHQSTRPLFCQLGSELRTSGNCFQGWMTVWLFVDLQWYETIQEKDINNLWILKHLEILKQIEAIRNGTRHVSGLDSVDASVSFCAYVFRMALLWFIGATEQRWRLLLAKICWHTALRKLHNFFGHFFLLHSTPCRLGQSNYIWFNE